MNLIIIQFFLFSLTLLIKQCFSLQQSTCNYVYNSLDKKAWATKVCIPWDTQSSSSSSYHVQYVCVNDSMNVQYYSDNQCNNLVSSINLAEYINFLNQNNDTSASIYSYSCKGQDGCYAAYLENCNSSQNTVINYSPMRSCIADNSTSTSWIFECDDDGLIYFSFQNTICDGTPIAQLITTCSQIGNSSSSWEYWKCQLPPTLQPTNVPSLFPTLQPSNSPSNSPTYYPTWYIPFYGLNLSGLVNNVENDNSSQGFMIISSFNIYLLFITLLVSSWIMFA